MKITEWQNCYPSNWKGVIVAEAMAHPAKYSSKLIRRIYEHLFEMDWLKAGDRVVDPFGGVALGALDAMRLGLDWTGAELEEKFYRLGWMNILSWLEKYRNLPRWGTARMVHGDSRKLLELISDRVQVSLSSPPYSEMDLNYRKNGLKVDGKDHYERPYMQGQEDDYGSTPGQLGAMKAHGFDVAISSPPYVAMQVEKNSKSIDRTKQYEIYKKSGGGQTFEQFCHTQDIHSQGYGNSDGQLSAMRPGNFDAAISSPPFLQSEGGAHVPSNYADDPTFMARHAAGNKSSHAYGESTGQLSDMKDGGFEAAVSSPPFNANNHNAIHGGSKGVWGGDSKGRVKKDYILAEHEDNLGNMNMDGFSAAVSSPPYENVMGNDNGGNRKDVIPSIGSGGAIPPRYYGDGSGQLGNDSGDDFWLAARTIVEQVYLALAPGGHAVWVVKDYVKNKKIVPFCDQWRHLCEAVGFVTLHEHHAMLVHHKGTQHTLEGGLVEKKTESKSFFRRLAEKNGSPRIDYETVYCMEKPQ